MQSTDISDSLTILLTLFVSSHVLQPDFLAAFFPADSVDVTILICLFPGLHSYLNHLVLSHVTLTLLTRIVCDLS